MHTRRHTYMYTHTYTHPYTPSPTHTRLDQDAFTLPKILFLRLYILPQKASLKYQINPIDLPNKSYRCLLRT